jgi:hypothetical protein
MITPVPGRVQYSQTLCSAWFALVINSSSSSSWRVYDSEQTPPPRFDLGLGLLRASSASPGIASPVGAAFKKLGQQGVLERVKHDPIMSTVQSTKEFSRFHVQNLGERFSTPQSSIDPQRSLRSERETELQRNMKGVRIRIASMSVIGSLCLELGWPPQAETLLCSRPLDPKSTHVDGRCVTVAASADGSSGSARAQGHPGLGTLECPTNAYRKPKPEANPTCPLQPPEEKTRV